MAKRKDIQSAMASKRFDGPYARDAYPEGLGGDWTRDEHAKEPERKARPASKKRIGKASE
jgi:hypothetical protein